MNDCRPEDGLHAVATSDDDVREQLDRALDALHNIGSAFYARRAIAAGSRMTAPLRESMARKALTDEQIEQLALDTWEGCVMAMQKGQPS